MKIKIALLIKSFLLAFVALALTSAIIITSLYIDRNSLRPESDETTVLIGIEDKNKMIALTVINFDPQNSMVSFLPIPDNTLLENSVILQSLYSKENPAALIDRVEGIIGTQIHRYAIFSTTALVDVIDDMGEFEYLIPHKFVYEGQLHSGLEKSMDGSLAKAMFTYTEYDMKKVSISDMAMSFIYSFLSKFATSSYSAQLQDALVSVFEDNTIATNLEKEELISYSQLFSRYTSFSHKEVKLEGTVHNDSSSSIYFTPNTLYSTKNIFK